ncbi:MAG: ASCH domain-containing protein [Gammaproteobacteria bacterium]|nr:ASCH domain-containing protein [Gammaproteobacteria bacterium]
MTVSKALIIDEPWISKILNGEKDWEIRSTEASHRGVFGLIRKGSGQVVGVANLSSVSGPYDSEGLEQFFGHHHVGADVYENPDYKWRYAWQLKGIKQLEKPVNYRHRNGAVTWTNLDIDGVSFD